MMKAKANSATASLFRPSIPSKHLFVTAILTDRMMKLMRTAISSMQILSLHRVLLMQTVSLFWNTVRYTAVFTAEQALHSTHSIPRLPEALPAVYRMSRSSVTVIRSEDTAVQKKISQMMTISLTKN